MSSSIAVGIVEDDVRFAETFAAAICLQPDMHVAGCAATVRDARRMLEEQTPDVLLVDLGLPDARGTELIRYSTARRPCCDVMVVSVFGDEQNVLEALEAGASGYLLKDAMSCQITDEIRVLKAGGSPINPLIARRLLSRFTRPVSERAAEQSLSERERTVLQLVAKGFSYEEISRLLSVSRHTISTYVKRTYVKLQVHSKTEAVYEARRLGLVQD